MRISAIVLSLGLLLGACGGGGGGNGTPTTTQVQNLSGNYRVNLNSSRFGLITGNASIAQSGSSLSGSFTNSRGGNYRISGTVSGDSVQITLTGTNNSQRCTGNGTITDGGDQASGTFSCNDGDSGQVTLTRV
jgi:hypothetical protein